MGRADARRSRLRYDLCCFFSLFWGNQSHFNTLRFFYAEKVWYRLLRGVVLRLWALLLSLLSLVILWCMVRQHRSSFDPSIDHRSLAQLVLPAKKNYLSPLTLMVDRYPRPTDIVFQMLLFVPLAHNAVCAFDGLFVRLVLISLHRFLFVELIALFVVRSSPSRSSKSLTFTRCATTAKPTPTRSWSALSSSIGTFDLFCLRLVSVPFTRVSVANSLAPPLAYNFLVLIDELSPAVIFAEILNNSTVCFF